MGLIKTFECNVCKEVKRKTNGWFITWMATDTICVRPMPKDYTGKEEDTTVCGKSCLHKQIDSYLGECPPARR